MALVIADRVKETTTTTGTGALSLGGAETNYVAFSSALADADTTYYAIVDYTNNDWEVGLGTYASAGNTLTRTTVLASTNAGSAVNLSAGTKDVFITYPSGKAVYGDASNDVRLGGNLYISNGAGIEEGGTSYFTDFVAASSNGTDDDGLFAFYGGTDFNRGAGVVVYGDDHATNANEIRFLNGAFVERFVIEADGTASFQGGINEKQYNLTGTDIDPTNGTIQYKTLAANTTFTESLADGDYVILMIDDGTAYTVTWPTTTWVGGSAPTLETTGYNVINLWQVNGVLYGASVGATS